MTDVHKIIIQRKYYFQQPIQKLFQHLIYREVPELPGVEQDRINMLYSDFDNANVVNRSFEYHHQITLKAISIIKRAAKRYQTERDWSNCIHRRGLLRQTIIWKYINRAVIVRLHEPFQVDDVRFCFKYLCFDSIYEYLEFEKNRGTHLGGNQFLMNLSDEYMFDLWFVNKLMNRAKLKNEQTIYEQSVNF